MRHWPLYWSSALSKRPHQSKRGKNKKSSKSVIWKKYFLEFSLHLSPAASKGLLNFAANLMIQTTSVLNRQHKKRSNPIPEKSERRDSPLNVNTTTFFWDLSLALPQMLEHSNTYWDKSNSWPTEKMVYWKYFPNNKVRKKRIFMVTAYIAFIDIQEKEVLVNDLCRSSSYHSTIYEQITIKVSTEIFECFWSLQTPFHTPATGCTCFCLPLIWPDL